MLLLKNRRKEKRVYSEIRKETRVCRTDKRQDISLAKENIYTSIFIYIWLEDKKYIKERVFRKSIL